MLATLSAGLALGSGGLIGLTLGVIGASIWTKRAEVQRQRDERAAMAQA